MGIHKRLRLFSNEVDVPGLDQLIERAKKDDADWYKSIVGDDLDDITTRRDFSPEAARSIDSPDGPWATRSDEAALLALGYSIDECAMLKKAVIAQVIKNSVRRPLGDIPLVWFEKKYVESSAQNPTVPVAKVVSKKYRAKSEPSSTMQGEQVDHNARLRDNTGTSKTFSWKGTGSKVADATFTDIGAAATEPVVRGQNEIDTSGEPSLAPADDSELSFLPSAEEFRSMLMEESRFRMRSVGGWIAPLLRIENKLRTKLYEGFLYFLDNGVGDVVDKAFALLDGLEREDDYLPGERGEGDGSSSRKARSAPVLPPLRDDDDARSDRLNSMGALKTRATWVQDVDREGVPRPGQKRTRPAGEPSPRSSLERAVGEDSRGKAHPQQGVIEADVVEEGEDDGYEYADEIRPQ